MPALDTVPAPPTPAALLEGPAESLRRALTLLGVLSSLDGLRFKPDDALLYAQYCEAVGEAIGAAIAKLEAQTVGLRTLRALLDAGGLEYVPAGQSARDRDLLEQSAALLERVQAWLPTKAAVSAGLPPLLDALRDRLGRARADSEVS